MNFLNNTKIILFVCKSLALLTISISPFPVILKLLMSFYFIFVITKKSFKSVGLYSISILKLKVTLNIKIYENQFTVLRIFQDN